MTTKFNNYADATFVLASKNSLIESSDNYKVCNDLYSKNPLHKNNIKVFFSGVILNIKKLSLSYNISTETVEEFILELYLAERKKITELLSGHYSIVIVDENDVIFFRDGFGFGNLYYYFDNKDIIISSSIHEILKTVPRNINEKVLPKYFLSTDINEKETFFQNIFKPELFEVLTYNIEKKEISSDICGAYIYDELNPNKSNDRLIKESLEKSLITNIAEPINQFTNNTIVNGLSGGTDSSFVQVILKKYDKNVAYTANLKNIGMDKKYAEEVVKEIGDIVHHVVETESDDVFEILQKRIQLTALPLTFGGNVLLYNMYHSIHKNHSSKNGPVILFDGNGSEGILGFSRLMFELKYIEKYYLLFNVFNGIVLRFTKPKLYKRYKLLIKGIKTNKVEMDFFIQILNKEGKLKLISDVYGIDKIKSSYKYDLEHVNKYKVKFSEKIYRFIAFEREFRWANNLRVLVSQAFNIITVFPFVEDRLFKYFINVEYDRKIKAKTSKYLFKKILEKHLPKELIYRKKIGKNFDYYHLFQNDQNFIKIIKEIKKNPLPYLSFDYEMIFSDPTQTDIGMKIINLHMWHNKFIK